MNRQTPRTLATKRPWFLALVASVFVLAGAMPARADIIYLIQSVSASAGAFDVLVRNTGTSAVNLDGFAFEVTVNTPSGPVVTLINATTATTANPYIFAGNSAFGPDITNGLSNGNKTLDAADAYAVANTNISLAAGATLGLGHVFFSAAGLSSTATVAFTGLPNLYPSNSLSDHLGNNVPITTFTGGTISPPTTGVPEPSAMLLTSTLLGLVGARSFFRRSRRKTADVAA